MAIREGKWDCVCGTTNLGRNKNCPKCGKSRDLAKVYLPQDASIVTDTSLLELANAGPDWTCEHCDTANRGDYDFCGSCGGAKGTSPSREVIDYKLEDVPRSADEVGKSSVTSVTSSTWNHSISEPSRFSQSSSEDLYKNYNPPVSRDRDWSLPEGFWKWFIAGAVLVLLGLGLFLFFRPREVSVTVQSFSWSRTIFIDEYKTIREGDWSIPSGGRLISTDRRIHHYDKVLDHYETDTERYQSGTRKYNCGSRDLGNGFFEDIECEEPVYSEREVKRPVYRDEPVYRDWYTYDIDRWTMVRSVPTGGNNRSDPPPFWGSFELRCPNRIELGCERENRRSETYTVIFVDAEGTNYPWNDSQSDWLAFENNGQYILIINGMGIQNDPLHPEK